MGLTYTDFWVIFDVCTMRDYYQDVHNLLALPSGATIRYEYRDTLLSPSALQCAAEGPVESKPVLLVYGQLPSYGRGGAQPECVVHPETRWIPTRIGNVLLVPEREGELFFFDIAVGEYPRLDEAMLQHILRPLIERDEVPFKTWVTLSDQVDAFEGLKRGEEAPNWQAIVNELATPPMQFAGDWFWRLTGPFDNRSNRQVKPEYRRDERSSSFRKRPRKVTAIYHVSEGEKCWVEALSHSPRREDHTPPREDAVRTLQLLVEKEAPLEVEGNQTLNLRQYTGETIHIKGKYSEWLGEKQGVVRFSSGTRLDGWPLGPNVAIKFVVKKRWINLALGAVVGGLFGLLAAAALLLLNTQTPLGVLLGILCGILAVAMALITGRLLTGKVIPKL